MDCVYAAASIWACATLIAPTVLPPARIEGCQPWAVYKAREHGVPEELVLAIVEKESRFNPTATGKSGEIGCFQIKFSTSLYLRFSGDRSQLYRASVNAHYGVLYIKHNLRLCDDDKACAIARHNQGHNRRKPDLKAKYVRDVVKKMQAYQ